ncbi:MAG: poly(A) polymerase I [Halieaceae bacterium]|nr:MAG: poly(A) polymerase I [Halieaceae bacterium]
MTHGQSTFLTDDFSPGANHVVSRLQENGFDAYVVGGAVRDLLLGGKPKDFDVATNATPEQIQRCFRSARAVGRRFQIVHVRYGREIIEVTTFRRDHTDDQADSAGRSSQSGRLLRDNVYGSLEEDAQRRDLTINALYYDTSTHDLIDQLGGQADVVAGIIRIIGDPAERYREDPVRMLRVLRFAARLGFTIATETETAIAHHNHLLRDIPPARLFDEWLKLFMNGFSAPTCQLLRKHDLLIHLMGDVMDTAQANEHSTQLQNLAMTNTDQRVADDRPVTPAFLLAALLWPATETRAALLAEQGESAIQAMHQAGQQIVLEASQHMAIPKRFSLAMRDIWDLQPRLERRQPKKSKTYWPIGGSVRLLICACSASKPVIWANGCSSFWTAQQEEIPDLVGSARGRQEDRGRRRQRPRRRQRNA